MTDDERLYDFRIATWTPATLPMARLAEYLGHLAMLFGNKEHVHFLKILKGSAMPVISVDQPAQVKVAERLNLVHVSDAPQEICRARDAINQLLRADKATAYLRVRGGPKIIEFKGSKTPLAEEVVLSEQGELDGIVIRVGGKDDSVPVHLEGEDGQFFRCNTKRDIAKQLAAYLFGNPVRVSGKGRWRRTADRNWELDVFDIQSFEALDPTPLDTVVAELRQVDGSEWNSLENPQVEWKKLRGD